MGARHSGLLAFVTALSASMGACAYSFPDWPSPETFAGTGGSSAQSSAGSGGGSTTASTSTGAGGSSTSTGAGGSSTSTCGGSDAGTSCAHDPCAAGPPLNPTCDVCVSFVCNADPACCSTDWGADCLVFVLSSCGPARCSSDVTACAHSPCTTGPALDGSQGTACNPYVYEVCAQGYGNLPSCCMNEWVQVCVDEAKMRGLTCC